MCCLAQNYYKILPSAVMSVKISEITYTHTVMLSSINLILFNIFNTAAYNNFD